MEELRRLADKHKLILIEDCAQAWGAIIVANQLEPSGTSAVSHFKIPSKSPAAMAASSRATTTDLARA